MATSPEATNDGSLDTLTEYVAPVAVDRLDAVVVETPLMRAGDVPIGVALEAAAGGAVAVVGARGPAGPPGPPGPASTGFTRQAQVDLNAYTVVKVIANGMVQPASSLTFGDGEATTGITTAAALAGEQVPIRTVGPIDVNTTLPVGPLYLGADGALTPDHNSGDFQLRVGYAQTPTLLIIRIDPPIYVL